MANHAPLASNASGPLTNGSSIFAAPLGPQPGSPVYPSQEVLTQFIDLGDDAALFGEGRQGECQLMSSPSNARAIAACAIVRGSSGLN
jgi:hypothetical protein